MRVIRSAVAVNSQTGSAVRFVSTSELAQVLRGIDVISSPPIVQYHDLS